jgi:virginiamycin B lyase
MTPDTSGTMGSIGVGFDQQLWFADGPCLVQAYNVSSTSFTAYGIGNAYYEPLPASIAAGPDDAMWITDTATPSIERLYAGYYPAFYTNLASGTLPQSIVTGADGNRWFTDSGNSDVDRISITGNVLQVPTAGTTQGIAAGPDDAIWFTEPAAGKIGRYDLIPSDSTPLTEVTVGGQPTSIALGPDGNMWFTDDSGAGHIVSISTDGHYTVTSFASSPAAGPSIIAQGPDNAMWFVATGEIGRFDVGSHAVSPLSYPAGGTGPAEGIVAGPDDNLYYTLQGSDQLVEIALSPTPSLRHHRVRAPTHVVRGSP